MNRILITALTLGVSACSATPGADPTATEAIPGNVTPSTAPPGEVAEVRYVFDGDSIEVTLSDGTTAEVRLIGINAPEGDECHGDSSKSELEETLGSGSVTLVSDSEETDQFGRLLRHVYVGGNNINLLAIANGNALALQSGHTQEPHYISAGTEAAYSGRGLWAATACGSSPPLPAVSISGFDFDPPGRDAEDPNSEWVSVRNESPDPVDMEGWILRDESTQHRFHFPPGTEAAPGSSVTVRSGCGDPTPSELYWCARDPVWSNGGDTVILQLPDGTVVDWERYDGTF